MNNLMFGGIAVAGVAMATAGGMSLGSMSAKSFDYQTATVEERAAFLEKHAEPMSRGLKRALISPSGIGPSMRLTDTKVNTARKEINFIITVGRGFAANQAFRDAKREMYGKMCPRYKKSVLGREDVRRVALLALAALSAAALVTALGLEEVQQD